MSAVLVHAHSFAIDRGSASHVDIEVDLRGGLPAFAVIGLGGGPARDVRERVQAALHNSGFALPRRRITVNVTPITRHGGPEFDLAVACGVLAASGTLDPRSLRAIGLCAELGLGGGLRPCGAIQAASDAAVEIGLATLVVARSELARAEPALPARVVGRETLVEVVELLGAERAAAARSVPSNVARAPRAGAHAPRAGGYRASAGGERRA